MDSVPLDVVGELRVVTANSIWLIRPDTYCRMPRRELPRPPLGPDLVDGIWHDHVGVWLLIEAVGSCIRILPPGRRWDASGIVTGSIVSSEPELELELEPCVE